MLKRCEPRLCNVVTAEVNGIVGHKEGLSNKASCSSRRVSYVIKGSEFAEGGPIYMHDGGESKAKQIAVLSFLSEHVVCTECVHF